MNKKLIICLMLGIFLISLASAGDYTQHKMDTNFTFSMTSNNATGCNLTLINSPTDVVTINQAGTQTSQTFNFSVDQGNYSTQGDYCHQIECFDGSTYATGEECISVSYLGKELSTGAGILYIGFLSLLILTIIGIFIIIGFLPSKNTTDEEGKIMSISYLKYLRNVFWMVEYFLFIAIIFLASNIAFAFLEEQMFAKVLFVIFQVSMLMAPVIVIVWLIWIFASMFHDKQFQQMLNRGFFPQGKL